MMGKTALLVAMVIVGIVLGVILPFVAEGTPAAPSVQLQTRLNPTAAQTVTLTFFTSAYSVQPINSIDQQGAKVVYSVYQNGAVFLSAQQTAVNIIGSSGFQSNLAGTVSFTLPAVCAQGQCTTENLTIVSYAVVPSWTGTYTSVTNTTEFTGAPTSAPPVNPAPTGQFYFNVLGAFTALGAIEFTLAAGFGGLGMVIPGGGLGVLTLIEYAQWVLRSAGHA
ncbi:MAG: hypothetical protein KGI98_16165 [Euryarchaeota archaeon]|nr:hypothetical protein [Euryarchaeota archaeon]MDE1879534.1 hypothetical protein [Euryarchaeota archaeon]